MSRLLRALAMVAPGAAVARARALSVIDAQSRYAGAQGGRRASSWVGGGSSATAISRPVRSRQASEVWL